jgi:hypothetical protein
MIKLEIIGHVVQYYFRNCLNVHHVHEFKYEEDEE